jgi:hypothetical protein
MNANFAKTTSINYFFYFYPSSLRTASAVRRAAASERGTGPEPPQTERQRLLMAGAAPVVSWGFGTAQREI